MPINCKPLLPPWELFKVKPDPWEFIPVGVADVPIVPKLSIVPEVAPPPHCIALKPSESITPFTPLLRVMPEVSILIANCDLL